MDNAILQDISKINTELVALHHEGASLRALQQAHSKDIADREARVAAEYAATLSAISAMDSQNESIYRQKLSDVSDAQNAADREYTQTAKRDSDTIRAKYDFLINKNRDLITSIEGKCKDAAEGNEKLLQKYGQIPSVVPPKPDLKALFDLYDKIMTDTAESFLKKALKKDGYYSQNDMIADFLRQSAEAIAYLTYEINTVLPRNCNAEIQAAMNAAQAVRKKAIADAMSSEQAAQQSKTAGLRKNEQKKQNAETKRQKDLEEIKKLQQAYLADEQAKILAASRRKDAFFETPLVTAFSSRVKTVLADSGCFEQDWTNYSYNRKSANCFSWGKICVPVTTESRPLKMALAEKIPAFCKGDYFQVPLLLENGQAYKVYIQYETSTKAQAYGHIQTFILQKLRSNTANHINVYFADPNDRGQNIGILNAAKKENEAIGVKMQNAKDGIRDLLKEIVAQIDETNSKLGSCNSIFEFNKTSDQHIKETILVLCDVQSCVETDTLPLLKVIWQNALRCGISIVLTSVTPPSRLAQFYPNTTTDWSFIRDSEMFGIVCTNSAKIIKHKTAQYQYELAAIHSCHSSFLRQYRQSYAESKKINNLFLPLSGKLGLGELSEEQKRYGRAYNGIRLPIMIDTERNTVCRDFIIGTENSQHTLITGGTGSGKSRFLQTIISSVIMNYHPDDVELWLIDCKKVEFKKFIELRPPHVRLVSLERTQDFTFAFLDYLSEFANKRTKALMANGVTNIKDYRRVKNDPYCMPRVVIIIDEFHAITTNVNMDLKYRQMLEDALSEYRNLGISFIFSDQSVSGLKGLTEKGRQQLHNRVAMKNSLSEMKETLQLLNSNFAPETFDQMEKSEGYGDFWWNRNPNTRYKNIYIDDATEEALVRQILAKKAVITQDTKIILVDGNERSKFNEQQVAAHLLAAHSDGYDASAMQFCVGVPTTLDDIFSFKLQQKYNNNVLIAGQDTKMTADVILAMAKSLSIVENSRIVVFADSTNDCYRILRHAMSFAKTTVPVELYDDYTKICEKINGMHSQIKAKSPLAKKTLVFWLGLPDMYDEFCVSPPKPANIGIKQEEKNADKNKGFVLSNSSDVLKDPQLAEMASNLGVTVEEMLSFFATDLEDSECNSNENMCYNATQDALELFAMGGKYGLFNVVLLENSNDTRKIKGFNTEHFIHKIAFCMSKEASVEWGFLSAAAGLTEGLTALYTNGIHQKVFKPYINE